MIPFCAASTTCPAEVLRVSVRLSRYSALNEMSFLRVNLTPNSGANFSVIATVEMFNEMRVTDFDEDGGWAAKTNVNLNVSDIATLNFGAHIETAGFGGVDQSLNNRRLDDYTQYNFGVQVDAGRFLPEKAKLTAPIFYSYTKEKTSPKWGMM